MLRIEGLVAGYGAGPVLQGLDLALAAGETLALVGRNGMGKTTALRAIMGELAPSAGRMTLEDRDLNGLDPAPRARLGLGLVPEGRQLFPNLTVRENLVATARPGDWTLAAVLDLFPPLAERLDHGGRQLSGGEQQMLAIGRALMTNPRLLLLDEATEGLAPRLRSLIWQVLGRLKAAGLTILIVDKDLAMLERLADRALILEKGRGVWQGPPAALLADPELTQRHLGLGAARTSSGM